MDRLASEQKSRVTNKVLADGYNGNETEFFICCVGCGSDLWTEFSVIFSPDACPKNPTWNSYAAESLGADVAGPRDGRVMSHAESFLL